MSGYSFIANDYSPGYAVKALLIGTTIIALLEYWGQRIITKRVEKLKHNKKEVSPYLSSIIVKGIEANALLSSLAVNKCVDDGPQTRQVLISVLDKNDWVISFPDGVSIDMFLDIMTNLFWDNSDGSNIGMTGYYRSIEGLFDDKLTMIKYDEHGDFIMVNSSGVNYEMIVTKNRKLFFTHLHSSFVPTAETKLQFEPFDIEYTVRHTRQYKSIRIKDDFLQM